MVGQIEHQVMTPTMGWSANGRTTMAPYAIRRRGLQAEIQHVVKRYIIDHQFRPGDPLPGEAELARQLGISRPSLREAMKVLQTIGAVETRHGSGTYVGELSLDALADGLGFQVRLAAQHADTPPDELLDLLDLREAIETHLIRRAAGRHTAQQIASMRDLNEQLAKASSCPEECSALDGELHDLFYEPLGSRMKREFVHVFWKVSSGEPVAVPAGGPMAVADHTAIIDALADADRDAAVMAMTRHLRHIVEAIERLDQPQQVNGRSNGIAPVHTLYAD
jgi:DNA-binding FadR family transcriptional regulator